MKKNIELNGQMYTWDGGRWFDASFLIPPTSIVSKLNALIEDGLNEEDAKISNSKELIARARKERAAGQYDRAEQIARRVLSSEPSNLHGLSVLCAVLRQKGLPEKAVEETEPFKNSNNTFLLTSRAAALCDLERWEEAKKEIGRVLALAMTSSEEAFRVVRRIKTFRPDLYEKDG
jgi:tetratricopeptide (TPR) repeat protein